MTLTSIINTMTEVVTLAVPTLLVLAVFYWNISKIIFSGDNPEKRKQAIPRLIWSIIALLFIFSLGGLINIISATLLGGGSGSNRAPASSQTTSGAPRNTGTGGTSGATSQPPRNTPFLPTSPNQGSPGSTGGASSDTTAPPRQNTFFERFNTN